MREGGRSWSVGAEEELEEERGRPGWSCVVVAHFSRSAVALPQP